jgi:uncharacterized protein
MRPVAPARPKRVLIDTSAYFALFDESESPHQRASDVYTRLAREHWYTYTTNYVIAEAHALILVRLGYRHATDFLRQFEQSLLT